MGDARDAVRDRVRAACLALPETHERLSHGAPSFFVGPGRGKGFLMVVRGQRGEDRVALWCAAPRGAQEAYVTRSPEQYFVPPYFGHRGWLGVYLDRELPWDEVLGAIEDAWLAIAPRRLVEALPAPPGG